MSMRAMVTVCAVMLGGALALNAQPPAKPRAFSVKGAYVEACTCKTTCAGEVTGPGAGSPDLDLPIEDLDLSERPRNCLRRAQINTVGELVQKSPEDLLAITNFGQKSLDEVLLKLDERGLALRNKG